MLTFVKIMIPALVVLIAGIFRSGLEFVVIFCAAISVYGLWVSRLKPEIALHMAGIPSHLRYWIFIGFPLGLVARTLALCLVLIPIYVLAP